MLTIWEALAAAGGVSVVGLALVEAVCAPIERRQWGVKSNGGLHDDGA